MSVTPSSFRLANVMGAVYKHGNVVFADDETLLSPTGNRVTRFDLRQHASAVLPFECRANVHLLAVSPDGRILLAIDVDGYAVLFNVPRRVTVAHFNFKRRVTCVAFSPDGSLFAVGLQRRVQVWRTPLLGKQFAPFVLLRTLPAMHDTVTCLAWTPDGRALAVGGADLSVRIYRVHERKHTPYTLSAHRGVVVAVHFDRRDPHRLYSVSRDGAFVSWYFEPSPRPPPSAPRQFGGDGDDYSDDDDDNDDDDEDDDDDDEDGGMGAPAGARRQSAAAAAAAARGPRKAKRERAATAASAAAGGASASDDSESDRGRGEPSGESDNNNNSDDDDESSSSDEDLQADALLSRRLRPSSSASAAAAAAAGTLAATHSSLGYEEGRWHFGSKHLFFTDAGGAARSAVVTAASFAASDLLTVGFSNGTFALYTITLHDVAVLRGSAQPLMPPQAKDPVRGLSATDGALSLLSSDDDDDDGDGDDASMDATERQRRRRREAASPLSQVHTLSLGSSHLTTAAVSRSGEWLAFGSAASQLAVWEWRSESFVLKQQSHAVDALNGIAFSGDSLLLATAGDDGLVKLFNAANGFCFVTFAEHSAPATQVLFSPATHALLSSSLDGTVRAYDLQRYRCFRTLTADRPTQFSCVAVDAAGEVVCAAAVDTFDIYVWSLQTGRLLDVLASHTGPVSALAFATSAATGDVRLLSVAWDHGLIVWDLFGAQRRERFEHAADCTAVACRPGSSAVCCVATLAGDLSFWDIDEGELLYSIDGRGDVYGGRMTGERRTAKTSARTRYFTTLAFSPDGAFLVAGGNSKYVCLYAVDSRMLVRRFQVSHNRSLDGVLERLDSRRMGPDGPLDAIDDDVHGTGGVGLDSNDTGGGDAGGNRGPVDSELPGVRRGAFGERRVMRRPAVRVRSVAYAATGRSWAAATSEGLLLWSLDEQLVFDPYELDVDVTPQAVAEALVAGQHLRALIVAFRLNERRIIDSVVQATPATAVAFVVEQVPSVYVPRLVEALGVAFERSVRVEFLLTWAVHVLRLHGRYVRTHATAFLSSLRLLHKSVATLRQDLASLTDGNRFGLQFIVDAPPPSQP